MSTKLALGRRWSSSGGSFDSDAEGRHEAGPSQRATTPSLPVFTIRPMTAISNPKPKPSRDDGTYVEEMEHAMGLKDLITEDSLVMRLSLRQLLPGRPALSRPAIPMCAPFVICRNY